VKAVATFGFVVLIPALGLVAQSSTAQTSLGGAEAVREIDWSVVRPGSRIPEQMPNGKSDDPLEVGFARQWLERVIPSAPRTEPWRTLALEILTTHRSSNDHWAEGMEKELRELVRASGGGGKGSRVFCNSVGCLCYVERNESTTDPVVLRELRGETGRKFGLTASDSDFEMGVIEGSQWELTFVRRPHEPAPTAKATSSP
jgi:hypothetical protein